MGEVTAEGAGGLGSVSRSRWAAIGAAVAVALGAGGVSWVGATISSGARNVLVPIAPCRLVDTRPAAPLTAKQTVTYPVRGPNGACNIPAGATAISGNATITDPTDDGFMTIAPAGGVPEASNLNWLAGQSPTPNAFTVALSPGGAIDVYNDRGTVNLIIDVNGYYEDHDHDDRYYTKAQTDARVPLVGAIVGPITAIPALADFTFPVTGTFTTARSGRLLVQASMTITSQCNADRTLVTYWLAIDGVSIASSAQRIYDQPGNSSISSAFSEQVVLSGLTSAPVAAGAHTVEFKMVCDGAPVPVGWATQVSFAGFVVVVDPSVGTLTAEMPITPEIASSDTPAECTTQDGTIVCVAAPG